MLSIIKSFTLNGLQGFIIDVQVDVSNGIPCWEIVGLPDASLKEAKERVRTAIKNSGFELPSKRFIINLAPANIRKEGSRFDLAIAIAVLEACNYISSFEHEKIAFLGELSFDGKINGVSGILPICIEAKKLGIKRIFVPSINAKEAAIVNEVEIIPVSNLLQVVGFLNGKLNIEAQKFDVTFWNDCLNSNMDFSEVKGQNNIKRALEVAASGGHNCLMIGVPGSGKTMLARRVPTILPSMTFEEALEVTKIQSISGLISNEFPMVFERPFRAPHHSISRPSFIGGGRIPIPGEVSLAHLGVLFLDEMPEFDRVTLESLRGPLEDGYVTISRLNSKYTYPCKFMMIASMNPCPCGFYGSNKNCSCSKVSIKKYLNRISGPLLDRIDIQVEVGSVKYENLNSEVFEETSHIIRERVKKARLIQLNRYKGDNIYSNSELTLSLIKKYCNLDEEGKKIMKKSFDKLGMTARAYNRILKVARTIADMDSSENIKAKHLLEAIQYRSLDRKYTNL